MDTADKINTLQELSQPLCEWLHKNYNPHCMIIVTDHYAKLVSEEVVIPLDVKAANPEAGR